MPTYDDLTWPQVRVLAVLVRVNLNRGTPVTDPVNAWEENVNHNSIWALVRRDAVIFDTADDTVALRDEIVPLANYCMKQVEGNHD